MTDCYRSGQTPFSDSPSHQSNKKQKVRSVVVFLIRINQVFYKIDDILVLHIRYCIQENVHIKTLGEKNETQEVYSDSDSISTSLSVQLQRFIKIHMIIWKDKNFACSYPTVSLIWLIHLKNLKKFMPLE